MIYKYKVCLKWKNNSSLMLDKSNEYIISHDLVLNVSVIINKDEKVLNVTIVIKRFNGNVIAICEEEFPYHFHPTSAIDYDLFRACKTYVLQPINIHSTDVYMIKIFIEDIMTQTTIGYELTDIIKEIQFVNFKKPFEVMDLCILMLKNEIDNNVLEFFTNKALHFGFKSLDELIDLLEENNLSDVATRLIRYEPLSITSSVNLFYAMVLLDLNNGRKFTKSFKEKMESEYKDMIYSRMKELQPYFDL